MKQDNGVVIMKHTAKTLAKYLGMEVAIFFDETQFEGVDELITVDLESKVPLITKERLVNGGATPHLQYVKNVYPILKTVEDLTKDELENIPSFDRRLETTFMGDSITIEGGTYMLHKGIGAIPEKKSPTVYVSIHDNLPCVRWNEKGEYGL